MHNLENRNGVYSFAFTGERNPDPRKEYHDEIRTRLNELYQDAQYYEALGLTLRLREIEREISWLETEAASILY